MQAYWSSDVARLLGISPNTLRKWSLALENAGYTFLRDDKNNRAYHDKDILAFRKLQDYLSKKMSMENAVIAVVSTFHQDQITATVPENAENDSRYDALQKKFDEYVQQQKAFNQALLEQLQKRDEHIESILKARDSQLMQTLQEVLETKKLLAAAQEKPKKKWYQFWK